MFKTIVIVLSAVLVIGGISMIPKDHGLMPRAIAAQQAVPAQEAKSCVDRLKQTMPAFSHDSYEKMCDFELKLIGWKLANDEQCAVARRTLTGRTLDTYNAMMKGLCK